MGVEWHPGVDGIPDARVNGHTQPNSPFECSKSPCQLPSFRAETALGASLGRRLAHGAKRAKHALVWQGGDQVCRYTR